MRKTFLIVLSAILMLSLTIFIGAAEQTINVTIDGVAQSYDVMPVNINGRVLVPMRGIFEALGAEIEWRDDIKTVTATKGGKEVLVTIGSNHARIDEQPVTMDVAPMILEGRTMVPVRFVSEAMGENVDWDDSTKTVIITDNPNSGLKRLISDYHRNVPTEFTKSSELDDLIYYDTKDPEKAFKALPDDPVEMLSFEDLKNGAISSRWFATTEVTTADDGSEVLKIDVVRTSTSASDCIYKINKTLKGMLHEGDSCLVKVTLRTTAGGDKNGIGQIFIQSENSSYQKDVQSYVQAGRDWTTYYYSYNPDLSGGERATVGIRVPYYVQTIEIKEFSFLNYGSEVALSDMPVMTFNSESFDEDAEWRKQALEDIEKYRKGDFNVVVTDKDGNPIKNAEVELDMFEHEFEFGNAFRGSQRTNSKYIRTASTIFNAGVDENSMKWDTYENRSGSKTAEQLLNTLKNVGIKYYRGHALTWQIISSSENTRNVPQDVFDLAYSKQTDALRERINTHIETEMNQFKGMLTDWDVVNETILHKELEKDNGGMLLEKEWFDLARKLEPGVKLYYNEATLYMEKTNPGTTAEFFRILDEMEEKGVDYDGIGLQSHHDTAQESIEDIIALFDRVAEYGKEVKITEYSCGVSDQILQANFTRDFYIAAFSKPYIEGILMWGFWDGSNDQEYSPMYDSDWNLKPAGEQIIDLLYNKWWTRDAKANTDKDGKATIRGFYGDYDVTVRVGDKEKKVTVAFGNGYDNTLYVTMD